ncbi:MAG: MBL fold metallo-hydrolase, partial [Gammaproteobacteria bacterium]|nr:MBL fold metallo-hydrolase [Gammaproteobacteria bacterium]
MIVKTLPVGQLEANCYIVEDEETGHAMIIDPG